MFIAVNRTVETKGAREGGLQPPTFLLTSIFDELKKILLK